MKRGISLGIVFVCLLHLTLQAQTEEKPKNEDSYYKFWIGFEYMHPITGLKTYFKRNTVGLFDVGQGYFPYFAYKLPLKVVHPAIVTGYLLFDQEEKSGIHYKYSAIPLELHLGYYITKKPYVGIRGKVGYYSINEKITDSSGKSSTNNSFLFGYGFDVMIDSFNGFGRIINLGYYQIGNYKFRTLTVSLPLDPFFRNHSKKDQPKEPLTKDEKQVKRI